MTSQTFLYMLFKDKEALNRRDRAPIDKNRSLLLPNRSKSDYLGVTHGLPGAYLYTCNRGTANIVEIKSPGGFIER
jgi:hypothetical protein